jgi:hypothetical protein
VNSDRVRNNHRRNIPPQCDSAYKGKDRHHRGNREDRDNGDRCDDIEWVKKMNLKVKKRFKSFGRNTTTTIDQRMKMFALIDLRDISSSLNREDIEMDREKMNGG